MTGRLPPFAIHLKSLREKSGKSRYAIARYAELDEAYLLRLESGARRNPSRDAVIKIGLALVSGTTKITRHDIDRLLVSAGYLPLMGRGEPLFEVDQGDWTDS